MDHTTGNQTSRVIAGTAYTQTFDYDNRLTLVTGASLSAGFVYDAEGQRVKGTVGGVTTVYIAGLYEWQNGAVTQFYEGGALRRSGYATDNGVFYVVSDHLRSTSVLVNRDGTVKDRNYYYPYGGNRGGSAFSGVTTKRFTGQYHEPGLPGGEGLSYYNARWYDAQVGMFISADTLVPSPLAPQTLNRYAYVAGNPLRYVDPTGHSFANPDRDPRVVPPIPFRPYSTYLPLIAYARYVPPAAPGPQATSVGQQSGMPMPKAGPDYSPRVSFFQAMFIVACWFSERCGEELTFGPDASLTQDVRYDPAVAQFRQEWEAAGYAVPFSRPHYADQREGPILPRIVAGAWIFLRENTQLVFSAYGSGSREPEGGIDAVGGVLGSFDSISVTDAGNRFVKFTVMNVMGWSSATRFFGTNVSVSHDRAQSAPGPGGNLTQYFYWYEQGPPLP